MNKRFKLLVMGVLSFLLAGCEMFSSGPNNNGNDSSVEPSYFTVTWKNYNGDVLETDTDVLEGTTPTYDGLTPVKQGDNIYSYVWSGWSPEISPVTRDIEYTATFTSELRKYTVVWKNYDEQTLETDTDVPHGTVPTYTGETPTKPSTVDKEYVFEGWNPIPSFLTSDATYIASFREVTRKYTVNWKNYDGTLLKSEKVNYGLIPMYSGSTPTREPDNQYTYTFSGWSPSPNKVEGDTDYTATFSTAPQKYTVTWVNSDGTVLEVDENVTYGDTPVYNGRTPTKADDRAVRYIFKGWSPEIQPVTGNVTYTATYNGEGFFSFDLIPYKTTSGYRLSDLKGAPWIDSNLAGELRKIEKPSEKDDFYAAINYDHIIYGEDDPFSLSSKAVKKTFSDMFSNTSTATNASLLNNYYHKVSVGNLSAVSTYINNINIDTYFSSKDLFTSYNSFLDVKPNGTGYEVVMNDGYTTGVVNLETLRVYSMDSKANDIVNYLSNALSLSISESDLSSITNIETALLNTNYQAFQSNGDTTTSYTVNTIPWSQLKSALLDLGLSSGDKIVIKNGYKTGIDYLFKNYLANYKTQLKDTLAVRLAFDYRFMLGLSRYKELNTYISNDYFWPLEKQLYKRDDETIVKYMTLSAIPVIVEQSYIELGASETNKQKVIALIEDILAGYKELVNGLDWLSQTTKNGVKKKLDNMRYASCYSDTYKNFRKITANNLGSLSMLELTRLYDQTVVIDKLGGNYHEDDDLWEGAYPSYIVNAFYSPSSNCFVILNGLIGGGLISDSIEKNYAYVGTVIGHEITHAFDSTGSQYDENGNKRNWWETNDKTTFNNKVNKLINFYNKITFTTDKTVDGNNVKGEATADMGGMKVMLQLAKKIPNFDYDLFFKSYAYLWCDEPEKNTEYLIKRAEDEHPLGYLRANVTLAQFDEFINTYDIKAGDGMYIPENQRIKIW